MNTVPRHRQVCPLIMLLCSMAAAFVASGCAPVAPATTAEASTSQRIGASLLTPEQASAWTPDESKAVLVAWAAIDRAATRAGEALPPVAQFKIKEVAAGWEVFVQYGPRQVDHKPVPQPENFAIVQMDSAWTVTRIVSGG